MSLSCRQNLVQLARKYDALIITDDVYDVLQFPTSASTSPTSLKTAVLPRLIDIDRTLKPTPDSNSFGNAMSNGSFSKIAGPGARTGWAEASPKFTYGLSQCGSSRSGGAPSQLVAAMMYEMLRNGSLENHIESVLKPAYKKRYEIIVCAIRKLLYPLGVRLGEVDFDGKGIFGGFFIWVVLPKGVNAQLVAEVAKEKENLIVAPGRIFEVSNVRGIKFENELRLTFAYEEESNLEEGIGRLERVVRGILEGNGGIWRGTIGEDTVGFKQNIGEFQ